jgi:Rrf2 family iron-sulfur cluster assembly transcriptional regulator
VNLAANSLDQNSPVSISQIARDEALSPEFLEQIFFRLKKAGVIRSIRGPKGGFILNKKPSEVSIKAVLDAVGESMFPAPCTDHATGCGRKTGCPLGPVWQDFYELIRDHLSGITLKDILDGNKAAPSPSQTAAR